MTYLATAVHRRRPKQSTFPGAPRPCAALSGPRSSAVIGLWVVLPQEGQQRLHAHLYEPETKTSGHLYRLLSAYPDAPGPSYGGVGPSYGGVWGLNSLGFEGPRAVWSI